MAASHNQGFWEVNLAAGPLGACLRCNDRDIVELLKQRYAGFLATQSQEIRLMVWIQKSGGLEYHLAREFELVENKLVYHSPAVQGEVDLSSGAGSLRLRTVHPVEQIEYILRVVFAFLGVLKGGILLHGAGIVHRDAGFVFMGPSGVGKTTVSQLSSRLSENIVLNDDLVYLCRKESGWMVYSTPFTNQDQVGPVPGSGELGAIFSLRQSTQVCLGEMQPSQALAQIIANVPIVPLQVSFASRALRVTDILVRQIPVYTLDFLPDSSFWLVIDEQVKL